MLITLTAEKLQWKIWIRNRWPVYEIFMDRFYLSKNQEALLKFKLEVRENEKIHFKEEK